MSPGKITFEGSKDRQERASKFQKALVLGFLSSLFWLLVAVGLFTFEDSEVPKRLFPIFFSEDGSFSLIRLFGVIAVFVALVSFLIAYLAMLANLNASSPKLLKEIKKLPIAGASLVTAMSEALFTVEAQVIQSSASSSSSTQGEATVNMIESQSIIDNIHQGHWFQPLMTSSTRLDSEIFRLQGKSFSNLTWGIVLSTIALIAVLFAIFGFQDDEVPSSVFEFLHLYGPRFTFVLTTVFLASFFLRLHVNAENELTRVRNEHTNLDIRISAGLLAISEGKSVDFLVSAMSLEERNFILKSKENSAETNLKLRNFLTEKILKKLP